MLHDLMIRLFLNNQGATAIEYSLIAALMAGVIAGTIGAVGLPVVELFTTVADSMAP